MTTEIRKAALLTHLNNPNYTLADIVEDEYMENHFNVNPHIKKYDGRSDWATQDSSYAVLTDEEADEAAEEYIRESLWAFNADFLATELDLPIELFIALQKAHEDSNEAILALVNKLDKFDDIVAEAIYLDGRGHFLNPYDHSEHELAIDTEDGEQFTFYIYRTD